MTTLTPQAMSVVAVGAALAAVVGLVIGIAGWRRAGRLERHYRLLMQGVDGTDLAAALEAVARRLGGAEHQVEALEAASGNLDERLARALQRFDVLRFNAYGDSGGDQSFAIALLDEGGSGVVVSSLHGRDGVRVYAKPLDRGQSSYALSSEEQQVVTAARAKTDSGMPPG